MGSLLQSGLLCYALRSKYQIRKLSAVFVCFGIALVWWLQKNPSERGQCFEVLPGVERALIVKSRYDVEMQGAAEDILAAFSSNRQKFSLDLFSMRCRLASRTLDECVRGDVVRNAKWTMIDLRCAVYGWATTCILPDNLSFDESNFPFWWKEPYLDLIDNHPRPNLIEADNPLIRSHFLSVSKSEINQNDSGQRQKGHEPLSQRVVHVYDPSNQPPTITLWFYAVGIICFGIWCGYLAWICLKQEVDEYGRNNSQG